LASTQRDCQKNICCALFEPGYNRCIQAWSTDMRANKREFLTEEEYLKFEHASALKHEYVNGRVYAMSGVSRRHSRIQLNISVALHNFLDGGPCCPYMENMKVKIKAANCYYYPDIMVVCQGAGDLDEFYEDSPVLIIEVLSRSTSSIDRREKFNNYTMLESLHEYALVHQQRRKLELFRRNQGNEWDEYVFHGDDTVIFTSLPSEFSLAMDTIYRNIADGTKLHVKEDVPEYLLSDNELYELSW
jgi:Uma2 family endonuclease